MWHAAAPLLAQRHTVVAADLAGYGASFRPAPAPDHAPHSKRAMALDQVQAMAALGFDRFAVAGHDRGGRVAYRMALDHPDRVERLAVLDIVPTGEVWARADRGFARSYWHWAFLALPAPFPSASSAATRRRLRSPVRAGLGLGRAPTPRGIPPRSWPPTGAGSTTPARSRRCARTTAPARPSTSSTTTPTAGGAPDRVSGAGAVGGPRRAPPPLPDVLDVASLGTRPTVSRPRRRPLPGRGSPAGDRTRCSASWPTPDPVRFGVRAVRRRSAGCGAGRLPARATGCTVVAPFMRRRHLGSVVAGGGGGEL